MQINSKHITDYIEFLKKSGITVTLHGSIITDSIFMEYNYHRNPYCHYIKSVYECWAECVCRQKKIFEKTSSSYFGCCFAGVGEFVYPIKNSGEILGFISASGYKAELSQAKAAHFARKYDIDVSEIHKLQDIYLKADVPEKSEMDAALEPLVFMLEEYYRKMREQNPESENLYYKMLKYIIENCHRSLTMAEIANHFSYSVSTMSHLFKKNSGMTLPQYIDTLRLEEGKWYLENSNAKIVDIAHFLGYSSSNYFSNVFKKKTGLSPKEYRHNKRS